MTARTRYALLGGAGILLLGLVVGSVAYLRGGFPGLAGSRLVPDELRYVPAEVSVVAYADVREVMRSDFRQRLRGVVSSVLPDPDGQREFFDRTGIDIEDDIDRIVACLVPGSDEPSGLVVVSGRFDVTRLEGLAIEHGGTVDEYRGTRILTRPGDESDLVMAFVEPGLLTLGSGSVVRHAIDIAGRDDVTSNDAMMDLFEHIRDGSNAWVISRFDETAPLPWIPEPVQAQLPPLSAFVVGGRVNGGMSGTITAETRDEQARQHLHDVVQGFLALIRLQSGLRNQLGGMLDAFQLTSGGTTVTLSFDLSPELFELAFPEDPDTR